MDVINLEKRAIENWDFFIKITGVKVKVKVVGIGDAGCNMLDNMIKYMDRKSLNIMQPVGLNTDLINLIRSGIPERRLLGESLRSEISKKTLHMNGTEMKLEVGKEAAMEISYEEIKETLAGSDVVFIVAGFGGGTGTGASSVVAKAAKEIKALTVSIVTKPFEWEGQKRMETANLGLEELKKYSDTVIVIKNDRARESFSFNSTPFALGLVDTIVCRIVQTVQTLMTNRDTVELEDLKTIMQYRGIGLIGIAQGNRQDEAREIIENAIKSPLFDGASIKNAKGIMIHWRINSNTSPCGITEVMGNINEIIGTNAKTIFKLTNDNTLAVEEVRVTIIATGFESLENE